MGTIKRFEDIEVWQQSRILCNEVYAIISEGTFAKDFKLRDQINGSSGSVMDNIAEGFERDGRKEFIQFLAIAKGSYGETRSQLCRAFDRKHISKEKFEELFNLSERIGKMIGKFIIYLKNSEYPGSKFSEPQEPYN